ncbi:MAG: CARDB domain-containing protein [Chrysiogenia bacterium]
MKKHSLVFLLVLGIASFHVFGEKIQKKPLPTPQLLKLPDLTITKMNVVHINGECKVEITILNQGNAGVPDEKYGMVGDDSKASSVRVAIGSIPSVGRYLRKVDPLGKLKKPGGIVSHVWFVTDSFSTMPAGVSSVTATVDDNSRIIESNEANNRLTKRLSCSIQGPDLTVARIYMKPENPRINQEIYFFAEIKNIGTVASTPTKASFAIGGETYPRIFNVPALNPGMPFTIKRIEKLSIAQNYLAKAVCDSDHSLVETNESNNKAELPFTVN